MQISIFCAPFARLRRALARLHACTTRGADSLPPSPAPTSPAARVCARSQCHKNPGFTLKSCPNSCEVCGANLCEDKNATQCEIWGEAECAHNPGAVMRDCPKTCGVCSSVCADKEAACPDWAAKGECEKNAASLLSLCPQACGICQEMENFNKQEL